jgi:hypothetical protein
VTTDALTSELWQTVAKVASVVPERE